MESIQSWCFTVCGGIVFCGIVMMLIPAPQYQKIMQMVLGLFLLLCILSLGRISSASFSIGTEEAESRREEAAKRTTDYFLNRVTEQSEASIRKTVSDYLRQYGINPDDCKIYIETEENGEGENEMVVELQLPEVLRAYQTVIYEALSYELGITVRIAYLP